MSDDRFRSILENAPFGIYRVSIDGRFLAVNAALCDIVGCTEDELRSSNLATVFPEAAERQSLIAKDASLPSDAQVEATLDRKDGRAIVARIRIHAVRDASGGIEHFDGFVDDITALREAEQSVRQAEKLASLGELLANVAHELNNPLSAILLFAEDLLANEARDDEREALTIIAQQARRSRATVRDLLSFARDRDAVREPVESGPFFDRIGRSLAPQLAELGVTLHTDVAASNIILPIDPAGIEQVVTNLVINAAHAARSGGNVWLTTSRDAQHFVIDVVDDGCGIPDDVLPRIFEPFFTTKPMGQGTGLGLAVSRGIVQCHGGWIEAKNRETGGAQFTVRIPLPAQAEVVLERSADSPANAHANGRRRVLIVEDEETIRRALTRFYQRRGWVVTQAEDGTRAFERLIGGLERYDLVISDMKMPGFSGIELHAALREVRPDLLDRVVFCSGEVDSPAVSSFVENTKCRVLLKPFDLRALATLSEEIASGRTSAMPHLAS